MSGYRCFASRSHRLQWYVSTHRFNCVCLTSVSLLARDNAGVRYSPPPHPVSAICKWHGVVQILCYISTVKVAAVSVLTFHNRCCKTNNVHWKLIGGSFKKWRSFRRTRNTLRNILDYIFPVSVAITECRKTLNSFVYTDYSKQTFYFNCWTLVKFGSILARALLTVPYPKRR